MKKFALSLIFIGLVIGGCSFGEYADEDEDKGTNKVYVDDKIVYKFTEDTVKDKTFYKVNKPDENWSMSEYDFNGTHYKANQIKGGTSSQTGTYEVADEGYLELVNGDLKFYIKPTKEDDDKIYLIWSTIKEDVNKTTPTENTYFFKTKKSADEFLDEEEE